MALEAPTTEVADVLCLKLLRNVSGALDVALSALTSAESMTRYAALRLLFNLLIVGPAPREAAATMCPFVQAELAAADPLTRPVATQAQQ